MFSWTKWSYGPILFPALVFRFIRGVWKTRQSDKKNSYNVFSPSSLDNFRSFWSCQLNMRTTSCPATEWRVTFGHRRRTNGRDSDIPSFLTNLMPPWLDNQSTIVLKSGLKYGRQGWKNYGPSYHSSGLAHHFPLKLLLTFLYLNYLELSITDNNHRNLNLTLFMLDGSISYL